MLITREEIAEGALLRDLGGGLILRRSRHDDAERLAQFNAEVFGNIETGEPDMNAHGWVMDLLRGDHPTFRNDDFLLVEDTQRGIIVSSLCMISQLWLYEDVPFGVGRPELVGTHLEYRRRGLVRALFEEFHRISAGRDEIVQAITGIPWYYRQFGYELALEVGGGRSGYRSNVPLLKPGEEEPFKLRPAVGDDEGVIAELYDQAMRRYCVTTMFNSELWQYELTGRTDESDVKPVWLVVEDGGGVAVGALRHYNRAWGSSLVVSFYELAPGVSYGAVTTTVLRYLAEKGTEYTQGKDTEWGDYRFALGPDHPVYHAIPTRLPGTRRTGAWYMRVADLPAFARHVAPALEARLADSALAGHSGEIKISFYRDGLQLLFEDGRLSEATPWVPRYTEEGDAFFPGLTFLQLLFGYRNLDELEYAFADCWVKGDTPRGLLTALFPRRASLALGIV